MRLVPIRTRCTRHQTRSRNTVFNTVPSLFISSALTHQPMPTMPLDAVRRTAAERVSPF